MDTAGSQELEAPLCEWCRGSTPPWRPLCSSPCRRAVIALQQRIVAAHQIRAAGGEVTADALAEQLSGLSEASVDDTGTADAG